MWRGDYVIEAQVAQHAGFFFEKNQNFPARPPIVSTLDAKIKDLLATSATELRVKLRKQYILSFGMVWIIFEGFINFYNKRNGQKIAKSRKKQRGLQAGVFKVPSKVKTWATGVL